MARVRRLESKDAGLRLATDAGALIARFGDDAYRDTLSRVMAVRMGGTIDGGRLSDHWDGVRRVIGAAPAVATSIRRRGI